MVCERNSNVLRRITTLLIICCLLTVGLCVNTAAALPGSGTQEDPWRIESLVDFDEFAANRYYWSGFTRLETDVNLAGRTYYTAIIAPDVDNSNWDFDGTLFTGVFDGNDHKIIGLTIDDAWPGNDYLGLFGCINGCEVRNLGLEAGSVSGDSCVGSLVGSNRGTVSNCYFTGSVSGGSGVGGLVGDNLAGSVSNCYSTGSVSGTRFVAGLVGYSDATITNCYSTSDVIGDERVGGLVGQNYRYGSISNCYSTGSVSGLDDVGGLVGENEGTVSNCYSRSSVTGTDSSVGGLVGENIKERSPGTISNCHSTGPVSGLDYIGGLVGFNLDGPITKCYSTGTVSGSTYVGGLVGLNAYGSISNCYSASSASGTDGVGGLVGSNESGTISNSYSTGDVSGNCQIGGLAGVDNGGIINCYSTGSVAGNQDVGGLVGYKYAGQIINSFWDIESSGQTTSAGGTPKTTAEMKTKSTFTDAGWDFVEIWLINEGATYPVLRQEIRSDLNGIGGIDMLDFAIFADHWLEGTGD